MAEQEWNPPVIITTTAANVGTPHSVAPISPHTDEITRLRSDLAAMTAQNAAMREALERLISAYSRSGWESAENVNAHAALALPILSTERRYRAMEKVVEESRRGHVHSVLIRLTPND